MNAALERTQYQTLLGVSDSTTPIELALFDAMMDRQMDGIMVIGPRIPFPDLARIAERIPLVLIAYHAKAGATFDTVNNDDRLGATLVVQHLVASGYRHIAFLSQEFEEYGECYGHDAA